jgi:hypothetical protein
MSPFTIVVILILTVLFIVLSVIPLLPGKSDLDTSHRTRGTKNNPSHYRALRKYLK